MTPFQQLELADAVAEYYADPLGFALFAYQWGEPGELQAYSGPDKWQAEFLRDVGAAVLQRGFDGVHAVDPIRFTTGSGHGIGKTTLVAWLVNWIMSTRENAQGTVTANTFPQLQNKTWAAIQKWTRLCITSDWWELTGDRMYRRGRPAEWFCAALTCREEASEAFAGQHAANSTSFYVFDEASLIPDKIWEVSEGGLTDGEPMIFAFGNPTRRDGKFYRATFGSERHRWNYRSIDSRTCLLPNHALHDQWIKDYGEDSDFVRVRVLGIPPRAGELSFIDSERIQQAQERKPQSLHDDPLVAGFDVSGGGAAWNVIRFRKGFNGQIKPPIQLPGEFARDRDLLVSKCAELLRDQRPEHRISMMFVDSAYGAPIVERLRVLGFKNVVEVNFGGKSPDRHQLNMRAFMWNKVKDWLPYGSIDPKDEKLAADLEGPAAHINRSGQLVIESKEDMAARGIASPDDGDALALTFAQPVAPAQEPRKVLPPPRPQTYAPFG